MFQWLFQILIVKQTTLDVVNKKKIVWKSFQYVSMIYFEGMILPPSFQQKFQISAKKNTNFK